MTCPVCRNRENIEFDLKSDQFSEHIVECDSCGAVWSVSHGHVDLVKDSNDGSFLQAATECVEGDDYNQVG